METRPDPPGESVWRSPLLLPSLAVTAGVALDRALALPFLGIVLAGVVFLVAAALAGRKLGIVYLLVLLAAVGAGYHQWRCQLVRGDDIALFAEREPRPARLRGIVAGEPRRLRAPVRGDQSLHSQPPAASATMLVEATHLLAADGERAVSGSVRLTVHGKEGQPAEALFAGLLPGDEVEATGRLVRAEGPGNPGEFDTARYWAAQNVRATLRVRTEPGGVTRVREGWRASPAAWLAVARARAHAALEKELKDDSIDALARALLLGEGAPMTTDDWAKFVRTGVVHVLAISGQHLVVVAAAMWIVLFRVGVRQRHAAVAVALVLLGYALLTGGKPPALRAAVVCCAFCGAILFRRVALSANLFALAWLVVVAVNPASLFEAGCQLSFLAVAVLAWCVPRFFPPAEPDPLEELIDEARPAWLRALRRLGWAVARAFLVNLIVWAAITPLAAYHTGMVAPAALLLGPPLALLASVAILLGFALLLLAPLGLPLFVVGKPLAWSLTACEWVVDVAEAFPVHFYVGDVPGWWVVGFYAGLFALFTCPPLLGRWRAAVAVGLAWLVLLLVPSALPRQRGEFRCTFLDVGHGGCAVVETPDGRVLLYDAGAMRGPDVAARTVAPFLWQRGISRIDDLVVSHPDLDHFNGVAGLADRFPIGRVLLADSFAERKTGAVEFTLAELKRRHVSVDHVSAGDRVGAGGVQIDVLHPPRGWLGKNANENSVVLHVRHESGSVLLTGDLEGAGLERLLRQPARQVDLLQAPHHGSARLDVAGLLRWGKPRLAVSCQGAPASGRTGQEYESAGVPFWPTWKHGAVTVRSTRSGLHVSGHREGVVELPAMGP